MGAWGTGPFENDAAGDFLDTLESAPARRVTKALRAVVDLPATAYLDVDDGSAALAACELVALSFGFGDTAALGDTVLGIAGALKPKEAQRGLALDALGRIADADRSELAALWHEGDEGADFDAMVSDLRARLEAVKAGARKPPRPKAGDVLFLPLEPGSAEGVVVQVVGAAEVAVFEGTVAGDADALEGVRSRPARRLVTSVAALLREARTIGHLPLGKALKQRKLYADETGDLESYAVMSASGRGLTIVSYDEAREHDVLRRHDAAEIVAAARGTLPVASLRSPEERVAELSREHAGEWAERRRTTHPGPFGDVESVELVVRWIADSSVANVVDSFSRLAAGWQGYGRPNEREERSSYVFAGLVAIWRGRVPADAWPAELRDRLPAKPAAPLLERALEAARTLAEQVITLDAELRLIWDGAPDHGERLRAEVRSLQAALA